MKINWQKQIHTGWRQGLGLFLIIGGITFAALYYTEVRSIAKDINTPKVKLPSPAASFNPSINLSVSPSPKTDQVKGKIHISSATQAELETLPNIGPSKAKAIIEYRTAHQFTSVNDLNKVKGIGSKTLQDLKPLIEL